MQVRVLERRDNDFIPLRDDNGRMLRFSGRGREGLSNGAGATANRQRNAEEIPSERRQNHKAWRTKRRTGNRRRRAEVHRVLCRSRLHNGLRRCGN